MKKNLISLLLALSLALSLTLPALAAGAEASASAFVCDEADLLTWEEEAVLNDQAAQLALDYGCGVYIAAVEDFSDYSGSPWDAANAIYRGMDFGIGPGEDGILLMLSMEDRDYALTFYGDLAHAALPEPAQDLLVDNFLDDFGSDDWYSGFSDYVYDCGEYISLAAGGIDVEEHLSQDATFFMMVVGFLISLVIALIVCLIFKFQLNTARVGSAASDYIVDNGVDLRVRHDQYLHTTVTRQRIQTDNNSGGIRHSSGGFSGRSGKF